MHQEFNPPIELEDSIKCFWYDSIDLGAQQTSFQVQPDGYAEIIFHFGGNCSITHNDVLQVLPSPFMVGLLNRPMSFHIEGRMQIIAIRCYPWTVFDLLGLPSDKGSVQILQHPIAQLHPSLNKSIEEGNIDAAITLVTQYLLNAHAAIDKNSLLYKAGAAMSEANGAIPVSLVAAAAHATVRTLERNFKRSSGHTVKDVAALMRFEQARNQLWNDPNTNLAGLAADLGYTDQSHLSREFKRYSGATPAAFARAAVKRKKAVADDFVAFIQA